MLRRVTLESTDVSEESSISYIRATRISELGTCSSETSVRKVTRRNIQEDAIRHSHRRENLKYYSLFIDGPVLHP
jgi:hypothetical protein